MNSILDSPEVEKLVTLVEEAARSSEQGVKRFVEPAQGTLRRSTSKRHHIVFGRRGSGKSSLLRKAAANLTIDRRPIAFVDMETFKAHSYPDVLLSVLISSFEAFEKWLRTAAINPATKTTFWQKLFGTKPTRPAFNKVAALQLADRLHGEIVALRAQLHSADNIQTETVQKRASDFETTMKADAGINADLLAIALQLRTSKAGRQAKRQNRILLIRKSSSYIGIFLNTNNYFETCQR